MKCLLNFTPDRLCRRLHAPRRHRPQGPQDGQHHGPIPGPKGEQVYLIITRIINIYYQSYQTDRHNRLWPGQEDERAGGAQRHRARPARPRRHGRLQGTGDDEGRRQLRV